MAEITFKIEKHIGIISTQKSGWTTELNVVSWNNNPGKYDIRAWSPDHQKMGKGITLTEDEVNELKDILGNL